MIGTRPKNPTSSNDISPKSDKKSGKSSASSPEAGNKLTTNNKGQKEDGKATSKNTDKLDTPLDKITGQPGEETDGKEPRAAAKRDNSVGESGDDDDIVARQIREAAEKENDPILKKKLWEEYQKIRSTRE